MEPEPPQEWVLICLRRRAAVPSAHEVTAIGAGAHWLREVGDVHPLDADDLELTFGDLAVATMSIPIIDRFAPRSAEDVRRRLWRADASGSLHQLTQDQAESFWLAWGAGVQHVSEILTSKGLWQ